MVDPVRIQKLLRQIDAHLCGYALEGDGPAQIGDGVIVLDRVRKLYRALGPERHRFPDDVARFDRD
jgi:hypothetical protein